MNSTHATLENKFKNNKMKYRHRERGEERERERERENIDNKSFNGKLLQFLM